VRQLIVTGDDFGLALPVNEAIEQAHRHGILSTASLMVGAAYADDAVRRAKALPTLRVGLHLVVAEGQPSLPPAQIPDLVDDCGQLPADLVRAGFRFFFRPRVRAQLEAEIRAQFEAFRATGLALDHVNAHNHMHLHPSVLSAVLRIGPAYGMRAARLPAEGSGNGLLGPWLGLLRRRLSSAGIVCNDQVLGQSHTGAMNEQTVLRLLGELPDGVTEMYFHPATRRCAEIDRGMPEYQHEAELAALTSLTVRRKLDAMGILPTSFSDL
jgi:hopanoid biosynthesis associated protein HpnK